MTIPFVYWLEFTLLGLLLWVLLRVGARELTKRPIARVPRDAVDIINAMSWVLIVIISLFAVTTQAPYLSIPFLGIGWTLVITAIVQLRKENLRMLNALIISVVAGGGSLPDAIERFASMDASHFALRCRIFSDHLRKGMNPGVAAKSSGLPLAVDALVAMEQGAASSSTISPQLPLSQASWSYNAWVSWPINTQLAYLAAITFSIGFLPLFVSLFIAPTLLTMFDEFGIKTNPTLKWISSESIGPILMVIALGFLLWAILVLLCLIYPSRFQLRITPWFGEWMRVRGRREGLKSLAAGLRQGHSISSTLASVSRLTSSRWIRWRSNASWAGVEQGQPLAISLRQSGYVTRGEAAWIDAAAATGNLPCALESIVEDSIRRYELKWQIRLAWMVPVAILVLGTYVGIVFYAVMGSLSMLIRGLS